MADKDEEPQLTREGLLGTLAGKTKEAFGDLVGNAHLAHEGRVQQDEIAAEAKAATEATEATEDPAESPGPA